jgi:PAS domain S-box-containing protein
MMSISQGSEYSLQKARFPVWLLVVYLALIPGIVAGGYLFYKAQSQQLQENAESSLRSVAQLKVDQIVQWRYERMSDAYLMMQNVGMAGPLGSPNVQQKLRKEFVTLKELHHYHEILLTDPLGKILLSTGYNPPSLSSGTLHALNLAFEEHKPVFADLHYVKWQDSVPQMDIAVPLFDSVQNSIRPKGAVILSIDARQYLFPVLQKWPVPDRTSETLIVRREGDRVLFLNELRHRKNTALTFSIPLTRKKNPAVMAVLGTEGIHEGFDYRNVKVIAMLAHIPDSPWYMVAKTDTAEAFAAIHYRGGLIFVLTLLILVSVLAVMALFWKQGQQLHYKALYQSEFEKQALRKHFEYLVKYASDMIILADENLRIMEMNERALEEYGYSHDEMNHLHLSDLAGDEAQFQERLSELKEKNSYLREGMHKRKDGSLFPVEISGRYIEIDDAHYYQGIIRNISERKEAEEKLNSAHEELNEKYNELKAAEEELAASFEEIQSAEEELAIQNEELQNAKERAEESDRLKTAFLQNMSHEIRTPMNAIVGFSQLLEENSSNPSKIKEFSQIISHRSNDLLSIINEILEVSRIETGQMRVNAQPCDMNHLLHELYSFFVNYKRQIGKDNLTLEYKKITDGASLIITDMVKFKQIFINLIQNALKFTLEGRIIFGYKGLENGQLVFFVSDTGKGIPEDKFARIFERFVQVDPNPVSIKEGLGLGLSIAKGLATLLGGKIWLSSELGHGTIFYFTLPNTIAQSKEWKEQSDISFDVEYVWKDRTFLVVEDNLSNQEYFEELLGERVAKIIFVGTGQEAIDLILLGAKIDLILMDMKLPDMSGFEATRKIKAIKPYIPVVAQTAYAMEIDREKCLAAGCDGYIAKPVLATELFKLISNYVSS